MSVVIPVYRNEDTIDELLTRLELALASTIGGYEVLFVDDASPDGSSIVLDRAATRNPRVSVLHLSTNVGQHRAALFGLADAAGDRVVLMDADLQDPPEAIPTLLATEPLAGAIFAGRRGAYESRSRLLTSRVFKTVLALLTGLPRDAGMFVVLRRPMVDRLLEMNGRNAFVPAMIGCSGLSSVSIPVERSARASGTSSYTAGERLRAAMRALRWVVHFRLGTLSDGNGPDAVVIRRTGSRFGPRSEAK